MMHMVNNRALGAALPTFFAGSFSQPSMLDWTAAALMQHGAVVSWGASALMQGSGFRDSFRVAHADAVRMPGFTFNTGSVRGDGRQLDRNEVHDRTDYIFDRLSSALVLDQVRLLVCTSVLSVAPVHFGTVCLIFPVANCRASRMISLIGRRGTVRSFRLTM